MTAKTALLHIGTTKTGTTSIQESLARAQRSGSLGPYHYPLFGGDRNHHRLTMLYLPYEDQPPSRRVDFPQDDDHYQRARRSYRDFLFRTLRSSAGAILSAEVLSGCLDSSAAGRLRHDLESLGFGEFHVVLYVRDPADFYLSRTQNQLKLPKAHRPAIVDPFSFKYAFRKITENWEQAFPGRLMSRRYPTGPQGDVLTDFSDVMQGCLGVRLPRAPARLNTTISAEGMVLMQQYREIVGTDEGGLRFPGLDRLVAFLRRSGQDIPQTRPALKSAIAEQIRSNHLDDAEFIRARYGVDLGLECSGGSSPLMERSSWRVEDILESVDLDIVQRLWEGFERAGSDPQRPLPLQLAARVYRAIPYHRRPARLDAFLRSRFVQG